MPHLFKQLKRVHLMLVGHRKMIAHDLPKILNPKTARLMPDYTGVTIGSITVQGLIEDREGKDLNKDAVWLLYCSEYECSKVVSSGQISSMNYESKKRHISGSRWESRYDAMIGKVYPGTSLTILAHENRFREGKGKAKSERNFYCKCSVSSFSRWVPLHNLMSGNTTTFKMNSGMRPEALVLDPEVDEYIGLKSVYQYKTYNLKDGRILRYYATAIDSKDVIIHHLAWKIMRGEWPKPDEVINHINHNTADNRACNLELLHRKGVRNNCQSTHKRGPSKGQILTSKYKGVCWDKNAGRWIAQITRGGKRVWVKRCNSELEAKDAYDAEVTRMNLELGTIYTTNRDLETLYSG